MGELDQIQQTDQQKVLRQFDQNEQALMRLLISMKESAKSDNLRADMIKAAEKILGKASHRSAFKVKDYEQISQLYVLVTQVLEQTNVTPLNDDALNKLEMSLKQLEHLMEELPNERSLKNTIKRFVLAVIAVLAVAALLTVPYFNAIFIVASALVVVSSLKMGGVLGIYGPLILRVLTSSLPGSDDFLTESSMFDKTQAFTQAGKAFLNENKAKPQGERKNDERESNPEDKAQPGGP